MIEGLEITAAVERGDEAGAVRLDPIGEGGRALERDGAQARVEISARSAAVRYRRSADAFRR
ncbi:hypothetical protein [Methylorubrum thiocyanatum]